MNDEVFIVHTDKGNPLELEARIYATFTNETDAVNYLEFLVDIGVVHRYHGYVDRFPLYHMWNDDLAREITSAR